MMPTRAEIVGVAEATGFQMESLEKVISLLALLEAIVSHPFLKRRIALKGGSAINLFDFDVPRLSVDVDLNYIGAADRETMLSERPRVEQALEAVCGRLGIRIRRAPADHAGGKWRLTYVSALERTGTLELDVNFLLRRPLWPVRLIDSRRFGSFQAKQIPVLDMHEIATGKAAALLARSLGRDLFDVRRILSQKDIDLAKLRLGFVVYGGFNRRDWREVSIEDIRADPKAIDHTLLPLLRADLAPPRNQINQWTRRLVEDCKRLISALVPLAENEMEFIRRLNDAGEIAPELITGDEAMQAVIREHPGLRWKALNVRKHYGLADSEEP